MPSRLIECVPNFSEGRDPEVLRAISAAIEAVEGVKLLNVDPGKSTNRTVFTFAGEPEAVCEAAFQAAKAGIERIDMAKHSGEHPRFGAMDVCPLVPIAGISMEETVGYARSLGKRLGEELGMTIYLYGDAASKPERANLSTVRSGEYEGLDQKLKHPDWQPDFGPKAFNARSGATAVGAREFLIAYNVNLNTTSTRRANSVAFDVRERGRIKRLGNPITGEIVRDTDGNPVHEPGALKGVKAIGWFIEEYGFAQVSMNLTSIQQTPVHVAFDTCSAKAEARGIRVTGSELVGLIPLGAMLEAGKHYLRKQNLSVGVPDSELIRVAIKSMGLDELGPFDPRERIIEYALLDTGKKSLINLTTSAFVEKVASDSPAPGGGSVSALLGALGAALAAMVANLSAHKRGWDDRWEEFSNWAEKAKESYTELMRLVDEDTASFDRLMAAFGLPKGSDEEKAARTAAIQEATQGAIEVPLRTMEAALRSLEVIRAMAESGNPNSVSDAGVGALCAVAAIRGAHLNVKINCSGLKDKEFLAKATQRAMLIEEGALAAESAILDIVEKKL